MSTKQLKINNNSKKNKHEDFFVVNENEEGVENFFHKPNIGSISSFIINDNTVELMNIITKDPLLLNKRDEVGHTATWTPLYWAVKYNKIECVKILLEYGANINVIINDPDECCGTVLDLAIIRNNENMQGLLREHAIKEDKENNKNYKAIRTKLRGKAPTFNFKSYKKNKEDNFNFRDKPQE